MYRQKAERRGKGRGIRSLLLVDFAHRGGAVKEDLRVHLPFVCKQLKEVFFKTAEQVPVYSAYVVAQHILAVVGKFHRLAVSFNKVLSAEKTCKVAPEV